MTIITENTLASIAIAFGIAIVLLLYLIAGEVHYSACAQRAAEKSDQLAAGCDRWNLFSEPEKLDTNLFD